MLVPNVLCASAVIPSRELASARSKTSRRAFSDAEPGRVVSITTPRRESVPLGIGGPNINSDLGIQGWIPLGAVGVERPMVDGDFREWGD